MAQKRIPSFDEYYMDIAKTVRRRANCLGKKVGAVIVLRNRVVATGYNGVPDGMVNCTDGGCRKCQEKHKNRKKKKSKERRKSMGKGYEECICVHAEQNALMSAARFGISIEGGTLYTTLQPCFSCLKQLLQAKIRKIIYLQQFMPDQRLQKEYEIIQNEFPEKVWKYLITDKYESISWKNKTKK